ncbi:MAG: hypothetical protein NT154_36705, partial [Verrucomicrobia bacterium]|nr:hypothetical protein [Verrucomicrobiota bacterium]
MATDKTTGTRQKVVIVGQMHTSVVVESPNANHAGREGARHSNPALRTRRRIVGSVRKPVNVCLGLGIRALAFPISANEITCHCDRKKC